MVEAYFYIQFPLCPPLNVSCMQYDRYCRILQRFMVALLTSGHDAIFPQRAIGTYGIILCRNQTSAQKWGGSLTQFTQNPHQHQILQRQKEADAQVSGRGGVQCPHLTLREGEGESDGAMKMTDGNTNGRAVIGRKGEGGGEGRRGTTLTAERAYLSAHLSFFHLDLQVLDGTLAGAALENKNRCHKTPLRLGFASIMTPLEMLRVWCSQQKPVRYVPGVVFITRSAATSLPSYHLTMMENSFFVFSTQRVVYLSIFLQLLVHFWQNQTLHAWWLWRHNFFLFIQTPG